MIVEKPKPKQLLRPITTGTNSSMNQSQFLAITCNAPEAREISRVYGAIGFGFVSHWLKNWRESFKPITKRSNRNHVITFDSHLKTALFLVLLSWSLSSLSSSSRLLRSITKLHLNFILKKQANKTKQRSDNVSILKLEPIALFQKVTKCVKKQMPRLKA